MGKQWDKIFKQRGQGKVFIRVQKDIPRIVKIFRQNGVKKVLDLGCGLGRHIIYLSKSGFKTYGIDNSTEGIEITKIWLKKKKIQANLKIGSIFKKLPYKDKFFDAIIATHVINHAKIGSIRKLIKEIERILKPKGLIFLTARRGRFKKWRINSIKIDQYLFGKEKTKCKIIGPRIYVPIEGGEKGLIHYHFNKELLKKEFKNFEIYDIWVESNKRHYCLLGELKSENAKN